MEAPSTHKHMTIATAGHVGHGKSMLITALTGIRPDRLSERSMTIDLGFASLRLPNGQEVHIVDVPAYASSADLVLLVIAADEGVMPQMREHLDILRLLDVKAGVVALTKCDLVDSERLDQMREEVRRFLEGTPLTAAPVVAVSAVTGQGLDDLLTALQEAVERAAARNQVRPADFRIRLNKRQQRLAERVAQRLREGGVTPPPVEVISREVGAPPSAVRAMLGVLVELGEVIRLEGDLFFHRQVVEEVADMVRRTIREKGSLSVGEFRDLTGSSRKYAVPLLEYLDTIRLTRRVGNVRILVE